MWSELLSAMSGHTGELIGRKDGNGPLEVLSGVPYMHKSEQQMINYICKIGHFYADLETFVSDLHDDGLYLRALRNGIDEELTGYRQSLVMLEKKVRTHQNLPLSHMCTAMDQWYTLLPAFSECVQDALSTQHRGVILLDTLKRHGTTGVRPIETAFARVSQHLRKAMVNQITTWVLYGLSSDYQGEFFVQDVSSSTGNSSVNDNGQDMASWGSFRINFDLLPECISPSLASKILFIGKATRIFSSDAHRIRRDHPYLTEQDLEMYMLEFGRVHTGDDWTSSELESIVESIRQQAAQHLWTVMTQVARLGPLLGAFKDFMLVGKGEFFLEFFHQAHAFCKLPMGPTTLTDAKAAYHQAASLLQCDDLSEFKQFELIARPERSTGSGEDTDTKDAWAELGYKATVPWPLQLIFTDEVLAKYNGLFSFLFRVNRVQYLLGEAWAKQMQKTKAMTVYDSSMATSTKILNLRANMTFLVDNLQQYLKGDVIDTQFAGLMAAIDQARDFDSICDAHHHFITTVTVQTFRTSDAVRKLLGDIFDLCESLCTLIDRGVWREVDGFGELERIDVRFQRQTAFLFRMLRTANNKDHLSQLLLRINYNHYFSNLCDNAQ